MPVGVAEQPKGQLDVIVRLDASMRYGEVNLTILSLVSAGLMVLKAMRSIVRRRRFAPPHHEGPKSRHLQRPHPCVTASPLSLEERPLGRVSKDGPDEAAAHPRRPGGAVRPA